MNKNIIIGVLVAVILLLGGCMVWGNKKVEQTAVPQPVAQNVQNQTLPVSGIADDAGMSAPDGGSIANYPDEYLLIPELKIGFKKVPGLTLTYTIGDHNSINFSALELNAAAAKDSSIEYCNADNFFPGVEITNSNEGLGSFIPLADGRYLASWEQQAACYNGTPSSASLQFLNNQLSLFETFLKSVQSY